MQVLLCNTNNSIQQSFVRVQCKVFMYCYLTLIILFNIIHLLSTIKWFQVLLCHKNNSIHQSFSESSSLKHSKGLKVSISLIDWTVTGTTIPRLCRSIQLEQQSTPTVFLQRVKTPPTSALLMTLNILMLRLQ